MKHLAYAFLTEFTLMMTYCAHNELSMTPPPPVFEPAAVSTKANGAYYTILEFEKGTSKLTLKSEAELNEFLSKTESEGALSKEIKILTWSDTKKKTRHSPTEEQSPSRNI